MSGKMKILWMQLPHPSYLDRNVPMAAGYLKAYAHKHGLLEEIDIEILSTKTSSHSGCQRLIRKITQIRPDVLAVTLYLWNVERSLHVIRHIKVAWPKIKVIVGGPEVTKHSHQLLINPDIDIFVFGEGERTFLDVLNCLLHARPELIEIQGIGFLRNGQIKINEPRPKISDLKDMPSPYLLKFIDPGDYREVPVFTMRGCMQGCSYCSWTSRGNLRSYSIKQLEDELLLFKEISRQKGEATLVGVYDSAFNASPVFYEYCCMIKEINHEKSMNFSAFVLADLVDEKVARLLKDCNFTSIEVGLQSVNDEVLANINRRVDKERFIEGVRCLEKVGIITTIDVILGLPGDSRVSFENTLKFLADNGFNDNPFINLSMFSLSLAHATKLSRQKEKYKFRTQTYPPFYVMSTNSLSKDDLQGIMKEHSILSADLNRLYNLNYPPVLTNTTTYTRCGVNDLKNVDDPIRNIVLYIDKPVGNLNGSAPLIEAIGQNVACSLSILILGNVECISCSTGFIEHMLRSIMDENPFITLDVFIELEDISVPMTLLEKVASFIKITPKFLDHRDEIFPSDIPDIRRTRANVFAVVPYTNESGISIKSLNCIKVSDLCDIKPNLYNNSIRAMYVGKGQLVDYSPNIEIEYIRKSMASFYEKYELPRKIGIFFRNPVIQRLWEQEYLKFTPERIPVCSQLMINSNIETFIRTFDENELYWEAITKWKLIKPEYNDYNIEDLVLSKIKTECVNENETRCSII